MSGLATDPKTGGGNGDVKIKENDEIYLAKRMVPVVNYKAGYGVRAVRNFKRYLLWLSAHGWMVSVFISVCGVFSAATGYVLFLHF
jgi:hypothetical protein